MHPDLFSIGGRTVHSYGTLIIFGTALGIALAVRRAPRFGVDRFDELAVGLLGFAGGIVGAALLNVVVHLRAFLADPTLLKSPGLVFYGGFGGGVLAAAWYCRAWKVPLLAAAGAGAPGLALGHALGRVGCFLGGCCFGRDGHPVQLYEAAGLLGLALALHLIPPRQPGRVFGVYVGAYAVLRLVTERFRGDDLERGWVWADRLSTSQALALVALAACALLLLRRKEPAHGR